jgi:hypothetical protein
VPQATDGVSRPTSAGEGRNTYLALKRWLDNSGVKNHSYRRRFTGLLEDQDLANKGNVMISTLPYASPIRGNEMIQLKKWLARGNTLLLMAALDDSPDWIGLTDSDEFLSQLFALTLLHFNQLTDDEDKVVLVGDALATTELLLYPIPGHPLMEGVHELKGSSDSLSALWEPEVNNGRAFVAELATEAETVMGAVWQLSRGSGFVIVSASGSLLSNRNLGEADNARFLSNVLAYHLGPGGAVIFDDQHQGLSELYDPAAFYSDSRLFASLGFLLGFWLLYLLGTSSRLAAARPQIQQPHQGDLVRAIGNFMLRKLSRADAGKLMVDGWIDDLERRGCLDAGRGSSWQQLQAMPFIPNDLLGEVENDYARLGRGERVNLKKLPNRLHELKRILA